MNRSYIDLAIQAWRAAGSDEGVYYISTPITTGAEAYCRASFLGLPHLGDLLKQHPRDWLDIKTANETRAAEIATRLRILVPTSIVINPAEISMPGWSQCDYDQLWATLIHVMPVKVVLAPGWEYSRGARLEVARALHLNRPLLHPDLTAAEPADIANQALQAEATMIRNGWSKLSIPLPRISWSVDGEIIIPDLEPVSANTHR